MAKVKAAGNVAVTYNSNALTAYCNSAALQATVDSLEVSDFSSDGKEYISGLADWTLPLGGDWDPTLDGYLGPDVVTPGTARTSVIAFDDGTTTVTWTWTSKSFLENYTVSGDSPSGSLKWTATLRLSGAPSSRSAS